MAFRLKRDSAVTVPRHPVVEIEVSTVGVTLGDELIASVRDVVGDELIGRERSLSDPAVDVSPSVAAELRRRGVTAAAERVARPLGRPVRAVAWDGGGQVWMVIHPDGAVSDVDDGTPSQPGRRHSFAAGVREKTASARARSARRIRAASRGVGLTQSGVLARLSTRRRAVHVPTSVASGTAVADITPAKPRRKVRLTAARVLVPTLTLVLLLIVGVVGAVLATRPSSVPSASESAQKVVDREAPDRGGKVQTGLSPVAPIRASPSVPAIRVRATGYGEVRSLRLVISASARGRASLIVAPAAGKPVTRQLRLAPRASEVVLNGLPAGTARWVISMGQTRKDSGRAGVRPVPAPPAPTTPSSPAPPPTSPDTSPNTGGDSGGDSGGSGDRSNNNGGGGRGGKVVQPGRQPKNPGSKPPVDPN